MSWKDILKSYGLTTNFQLFLSDVFNIPKEDSQNIKASSGIMQAIDKGVFLNFITEKDFDELMGFAQTKKYEKLIKFLEELFIKINKTKKNSYNQKPENRAKKNEYDKEYSQRPEVKERKTKQRRERYLRNKEKLQ